VLASTLKGREVIVLAGAGGVGKTTVSAALSVALARQGERVCVITIDPAKRLADALGIELGSQPAAVHLAGCDGSLEALMLDVKTTFDELITEHARSTEQRDAILRNRIYRSLSGSIAGAQEYMAMERLHQLVNTGRYDRVVLDTPPTRNALDFLDAPGRLLRFIEGRSLRMLLRPGLRAGRFGMRVAGRGANVAFAALERVTGVALLRDLSEFFVAFEGMVDGFHDRAAAVARLLASDSATFLVVTSPAAEPIDEAVYFVHALAERGLPFGGVIANRVDESPLPDGVVRGIDLEVLEQQCFDALRTCHVGVQAARHAADALVDAERRARLDQRLLTGLEQQLDVAPIAWLPRLSDHVSDTATLARLAAPLGFETT
jgi:anion-transporting  ArsA/GET3 family ATPase